jgi:hypothetical protein
MLRLDQNRKEKRGQQITKTSAYPKPDETVETETVETE